MKALLVFLIACGSPQKPPPDPAPTPPPAPKATPFEQRRDAGCSSVGDRIVTCAVADAKADLDRGHDKDGKAVSKADYDRDTASGVLKELKHQWLKSCEQIGNSHQVRVLEVCLKEETQCEPFLDCLTHLNDSGK